VSYPTTQPADLIAARLDAQTSLELGADLFIGTERPPVAPIPSAAVFVAAYGGTSSPDMGVSSDDRYFSVQVMVRGAPDGYAAAETVATDCLTALDRWLPNSDGYVECKVQSAGPVNAGLADQAQPRFTLNVKLTYHG
jgi:hypothetical protein